MRTFNSWMDEYGVSHKNPINQVIHKICVPLIMFSVIGLLWSIPTPEIFNSVPLINWASLFVGGCLIFYAGLNFRMAVGMLILTSIMLALCSVLAKANILFQLSIGIFIFSWIAQFYGHKVEGKKPSFLKDLAFLLIGPLWVLRFLYAQLGIKV